MKITTDLCIDEKSSFIQGTKSNWGHGLHPRGNIRQACSNLESQSESNLKISHVICYAVSLSFRFQYIPMPVLYGVLMYMGIASLRGMQFIGR